MPSATSPTTSEPRIHSFQLSTSGSARSSRLTESSNSSSRWPPAVPPVAGCSFIVNSSASRTPPRPARTAPGSASSPWRTARRWSCRVPRARTACRRAAPAACSKLSLQPAAPGLFLQVADHRAVGAQHEAAAGVGAARRAAGQPQVVGQVAAVFAQVVAGVEDAAEHAHAGGYRRHEQAVAVLEHQVRAVRGCPAAAAAPRGRWA